MDFIFNFEDVFYVNDNTWWGECIKYLLSIFAGIVGSVIILWIQFKRSINNHFLEKIEMATNELLKEFKNPKNPKRSALRNIYRPYLSVIIDRLFNTYGGGGLTSKYENGIQLHPCLIHYKINPDTNKTEDRWHTFNLYIERLISPLNSYVFLASIPCIKKMKKVKKIEALALLINQIELIVGIHDGIIDDKASRKYATPEKDEQPTFIIKEGHNHKIELINRFEIELIKLRKYWLLWVSLSTK